MGWLGTEGRGKGGACVVCGQGWRERTVWQARPTTQRGALLGDMPGDCLVLNTCGVCVCAAAAAAGAAPLQRAAAAADGSAAE